MTVPRSNASPTIIVSGTERYSGREPRFDGPVSDIISRRPPKRRRLAAVFAVHDASRGFQGEDVLFGWERSDMYLTLSYWFLRRKVKIAFLSLAIYAALC